MKALMKASMKKNLHFPPPLVKAKKRGGGVEGDESISALKYHLFDASIYASSGPINASIAPILFPYRRVLHIQTSSFTTYMCLKKTKEKINLLSNIQFKYINVVEIILPIVFFLIFKFIYKSIPLC